MIITSVINHNTHWSHKTIWTFEIVDGVIEYVKGVEEYKYAQQPLKAGINPPANIVSGVLHQYLYKVGLNAGIAVHLD